MVPVAVGAVVATVVGAVVGAAVVGAGAVVVVAAGRDRVVATVLGTVGVGGFVVVGRAGVVGGAVRGTADVVGAGRVVRAVAGWVVAGRVVAGRVVAGRVVAGRVRRRPRGGRLGGRRTRAAAGWWPAAVVAGVAVVLVTVLAVVGVGGALVAAGAVVAGAVTAGAVGVLVAAGVVLAGPVVAGAVAPVDAEPAVVEAATVADALLVVTPAAVVSPVVVAAAGATVVGVPLKLAPGTSTRNSLGEAVGAPPAPDALTVKVVGAEGNGSSPPKVTASACPGERSTVLDTSWYLDPFAGLMAATTRTPRSVASPKSATTTVTDKADAGARTSTRPSVLNGGGLVVTASIARTRCGALVIDATKWRRERPQGSPFVGVGTRGPRGRRHHDTQPWQFVAEQPVGAVADLEVGDG